MAEGVKFELFGDAELDAKFAQLDAGAQKQVLRPALRAAAKIVLAAAKANAPVQTGQLRGALKVRAGRRTRKGIVTMQVATDKGFYKGDSFYAAFVEMGHKIGKRRRGGKVRRLILGDRRKEVAGRHFILKGFEQTASLAKQKALSLILEGMIRLAINGNWPGGANE